LLDLADSWESQEEKVYINECFWREYQVFTQVESIVKSSKQFDAIICVAGGWAGATDSLCDI
jgi:hypoxanthine phosphoribosyltransferase